MPEERQTEMLGATRRIVVVLGLVVDAVGKVIYGEVVDPQVGGSYRFAGAEGIVVAITEWLRAVSPTHSTDEP